MVCDMEITRAGRDQGATSSIPAVMHSHARLTYTQVWAWLSRPAKAANTRGGQARCCRTARICTRCTKSLAAAREKRGAIDFDTVELAIEFDEHGKITRDRAGAAQRRAQADRGMHARGQRVRGGLPARSTSR